jgi:sec-independent protein translocase protein TatC
MKELVLLSPLEGFLTYFTLSIWGGIFLSSPFILYQIWCFISSALHKREKRYVIIFGLISFFLFIFGCLFGYKIILPIGLKFLLHFSNTYLRPMISATKYFGFLLTFTLTFGIIFQFPVFVLFFTKLGIVNNQILKKRRREVILGIFIFSAIFTPPDVFTQISMALPLIFLYELSIFLSKLFLKG